MIFSKQIAELKGQLETLTGQLAAATGNVTALEGEKSTLEARVGELEAAAAGSITAAVHEAAIAAKDTEIAGLKAQIKTVEDNVGKKVIETIAKAGVPAIKRDPAAIDKPAKGDGKSAGSPLQRLAAGMKIHSDSSK